MPSNPGVEVAMGVIVADVLMREAAQAKVDRPFTIILFFSSIGLLAPLCGVLLGFDLSGWGLLN
jgi:hypothetical protein